MYKLLASWLLPQCHNLFFFVGNTYILRYIVCRKLFNCIADWSSKAPINIKESWMLNYTVVFVLKRWKLELIIPVNFRHILINFNLKTLQISTCENCIINTEDK
jgi:hypothetical protein